ncbi:flagellar basal-body rod protein FlgF [Marinobacterium mangrovicola]|uniref:Flagellar basal-body rod protein FlgF n=1 Tax=Marinobacterium mangrovicola TaxID=1476959 RepID=A0A4R1GIU3_9GAMM|nr:flagellar basal-body rod protein FlgF [Marinobacterium mangrovicola]TCK07040.1 flagellar basal-body rod protein FlgF [Marinobacterium mangrovicola]
MDKLLYVSMTGARENMLAQQVHANNLANATTTGFKTDLEQARAMRVLGDGFESRVYSMSERPATDTTAGTLIQTGRELDVAVHGDGWIAVLGPNGQEAYTRGGELQINAANQLVTGSGLPVMGNGGLPVVIPPAEKIDISGDGTVTIRPLGDDATNLVQIDQIKLVLPEQGSLFKGQDGLMHADNNEVLPADPAVSLRAGYLESSNVNAVAEMTSIINLARQFEVQVKMMQTAEENSSAAANILQLS